MLGDPVSRERQRSSRLPVRGAEDQLEREMHLVLVRKAAQGLLGGGMEPRLSAGDLILIDRAQTDPIDGNTYVLR